MIYHSFCIHSTSPKPSNNFHYTSPKMFLSVMRCAKPMIQLCRLKVNVTLQCHGIYPLIWCPFPSPKPFSWFSFNISQMFLSVSWLQNPWVSHATPKSRSHFKVMGDSRRGCGCPSDCCLVSRLTSYLPFSFLLSNRISHSLSRLFFLSLFIFPTCLYYLSLSSQFYYLISRSLS